MSYLTGFYENFVDEKGRVIMPKKLKEQMDALKGKNLTVYINSYGGSVPAGVAMANMLARHDGNTTAVVDGYCCSIATQIFFAAKNRKMPENAYLMIHKPSTATAGDANEMRKVAEILDVLQEGLETTYRKAALEDTTAEDIHKMVESETWLTGAEAAQYFDIEVLESSQAMNCIGNADKLKAIGCKKIPDLNFADIRQDDNNEPSKDARLQKDMANVKEDKEKRVKIALALAKGTVNGR